MFERLVSRAARIAERRAQEAAASVAERAQDLVPDGVEVEAQAQGVLISGRSIRRRFMLEPALRWMMAAIR